MLRQINFDIGKVPAFIDRILNQFQQQKKTGIFEGIGSEFLINNESIDYSTSGYCKFTIKEGFATIHGGAVYNEEGTQFTPVDLTSGDTLIGLPLTTTSTGSLGIRVDLAKPAGQQASFYYKTTQTLVQQDLNALKTSGVYEFELYKYTSNGSAVTFTKNNTVKIKSVEEDLINIKASILAVVNTFGGLVIFESSEGELSVDLTGKDILAGDVLELEFQILGTYTREFKKIKLRADLGNYMDTLEHRIVTVANFASGIQIRMFEIGIYIDTSRIIRFFNKDIKITLPSSGSPTFTSDPAGTKFYKIVRYRG